MADRGLRLISAAVLILVVLYITLATVNGHFLASPLQPGTLPLPRDLSDKLRAVLGLGCLLTFPGLFLALSIPPSGARDPVGLLLQSMGLSMLAFILNLTGVKLAGVPVTPAILLGLGALEAALVSYPFRYNWGELRRPGRHEWIGYGLIVGLVAGLIWQNRFFALRELGDYWYSGEVMGEHVESGGLNLEASGITVSRPAGWEQVNGGDRDLFRKRPVTGIEKLELKALSPTRLTLRYLWQGPVGSGLMIFCDDREAVGKVDRAPIEAAEEGPTLRALDAGIVLVSLATTVHDDYHCELRPSLPDGGSGSLVELTGWPLDALPDVGAMYGWTLSHYYQILNIAENVDWARRTLGDQWVTINQPPLWSYVYAGVVVFVGNGLWAINLFFFVLVGLCVLLAMRIVGLDQEAPWPFWGLLLLLGVVHARIIVSSGSTNFPDNLYAFALLASLYALIEGEGPALSGAGLAASMLRYPGGVLVGIATVLGLWAYPGRRRAILRAGAWFAATLVVLAVGFVVTGLATGRIESWIDILYFETLPEHFHDQYDLAELLRRPPEFYETLMRYAGYTPVLLLAMRGRMARWVASLTLIYTGFLCFIDHFPSHYFVPLLYMTGVAVTSTLLSRPEQWLRWAGLAAGCAGLLYSLQLPMS